jgi:hypothetical protein
MSGAIWLASYPRSGNTWTRMALYSLLNEGADVDFGGKSGFTSMAAGREEIDRALEIDTALLTQEELEELRPESYAVLYGDDGAPRLAKVHDAWTRTPGGRPVFDPAFTHATIYLIRDPRDVAVSWARFVNWPLDRSVAFLCDRNAMLSDAGAVGPQLRQHLRSWSDHAASWIDESGLKPLVVRYEDQLADPAASLARIARHIGWDAPGPAVARAVEMTRFEQLAARERREGFMGGAAQTARFFHTGKSGSWRSVLTPDQAATLEREHGAMMKRFGYL